MADDTIGVIQTTPSKMDRVQIPRQISKVDVPRLTDRIRQVWKADAQHRPIGEWVVHVTALVAFFGVSTIIWASDAHFALKVIASTAVLLVVAVIATPVLLKLRFRS
jgi:hypothetical protein